MTALILQARLDSKRLPGKSMLPLGGKPLIFRVMQALNNVKADFRILACPEDSEAAFYPLTEEAGFKLHCGPKEDVLERYCQVIRRFSVKYVIRATGDNPFVFADAANEINEEAIRLNADYSGYSGLPLGAGTESVNANALLHAGAGACAYDREHVCPYLYKHSEKFKLHRPLSPVRWQAPDMRLTVDTQEDYEKAIKLFDLLKNTSDCFNGETIISCAKTLESRKIL